MSQATKNRRAAGRARKEAREEQQGRQVVTYIFGALIVLAIAVAIVSMFQMA